MSTPQRRKVPAMGTPLGRSSSPMSSFAIAFPLEMAEKIRQIAIDDDMSVSAVIRILVKKGMEAE